MTRLLKASLIVCALTLALPAAAQEEAPAVPVDKAPFHVPVFRNEYVALVNVYIPPGRVAGYHTHSLDQISVLVADADMVGQVLGNRPAGAAQPARQRRLHRLFEEGDDPQGVECGADAIPQRGARDHVSGARAFHAGLARRVPATRKCWTMSASAAGGWCWSLAKRWPPSPRRRPASGSSSTEARLSKACPARPSAPWRPSPASSSGRSRA